MEFTAGQPSDPKAIYKWFKELFSDSDRARVRRQIKYAKTWAAIEFGTNAERPSSILLTVLIAEAAADLNLSDYPADDDLLRELLSQIVERLESAIEIPNPVNEDEDIARLSLQQMEALHSAFIGFHEIAIRATDKETEMAAADTWQEAFDHWFPLPELSETLTEDARRLPAAVVMPEVQVTATSPVSGSRFTGINQITGIPKNCDIRFEVTNPRALPANSTISWMVRNEGREAENLNDLGHRAGRGLVAEENSAYKGTHYMDCVVKVNGNTVAIRRIPVTITGVDAPWRNPLRRPEYVKLRGRR